MLATSSMPMGAPHDVQDRASQSCQADLPHSGPRLSMPLFGVIWGISKVFGFLEGGKNQLDVLETSHDLSE